jgi:hypothetical protein
MHPLLLPAVSASHQCAHSYRQYVALTPHPKVTDRNGHIDVVKTLLEAGADAYLTIFWRRDIQNVDG